MPDREGSTRGTTTLVLCTVLHTFTHAYGVILVPLYFMMRDDLKLRGIQRASALVTIYGVSYMSFSYLAGVLADRFDRSKLMGFGLLANATAFVLMGFSRRYEFMVALAVLGAFAGTFFHPSANALVPAHFPKNPGMAIGLLGIGSGLGFFVGPQYAGWRAKTAAWHFASVAQWQKPCIELGLAGIVVALIFLLIAREAPGAEHLRGKRAPLDRTLRWRVLALAAVLGCRDFSGVASVSLVSIYLQRALHLDVQVAGFIVGAMMLIGVVANPIAVWLSPGPRRLPFLIWVLLVAGAIIVTIPAVPIAWVLTVLCAFQACHLGSYAISDAAMLERVPAALRGRVVGVFLTVAGTFAGTGPFVMGWWTDHLGHGNQPSAYYPLFMLLGAMMWVAALSTPIIAKLGDPEVGAIDPLTEISPATMEPAL
jgi:MFS family permease